MKPRESIRPRGVGPRPGTPKSMRTEGARLIARLRAKSGHKRPTAPPYKPPCGHNVGTTSTARYRGKAVIRLILGPPTETGEVRWNYETR